MLTPTDSHKPTSREPVVTRPDDTAKPRWRGLYGAGGASALVMVALILVQVTVYASWPPPAFDGPVLPWFELLQDNRLLGLLSLDLLYLVDSAPLVVIYLALYVALRRTSVSAMMVGTVLGMVGVVAYYASNTSFEMLYLSNQYAVAATEAGGARRQPPATPGAKIAGARGCKKRAQGCERHRRRPGGAGITRKARWEGRERKVKAETKPARHR